MASCEIRYELSACAQERPLRRVVDAGVRNLRLQAPDTLPAEGRRLASQHLAELQMSTAQMEDEDPARNELAPVELEGFPGQQVDRHGIRGESVDAAQRLGVERPLRLRLR